MAKTVDKKLISIAKRYADAILEIAQGKNTLDAVWEDLKAIAQAYDSSEDMRNFLNHPVIPLDEKKDAVNSIFKGKISDDAFNLLNVLLEKNKFFLIDTILYCYEQGLDKAKNILKINVVSAVEVDDDLKENLKSKLENKLHKSVKLDFEIDPKIIAGLILKIEDKTIDGSMLNKLESMERQLA